jgi:hypothetical protein
MSRPDRPRRGLASWPGLLVALAWLGLAAGGMSADEPVPERKAGAEAQWLAAVGQLRPGMTAEEVRARLGPPRRIARELLYQRYLEQWLYDEPAVLRVQFDCRKGQPPLLLHRPGGAAPARPEGK